VDSKKTAHAGLVLGPIYSAQIALLVGSYQHFAGGRVDLINQ